MIFICSNCFHYDIFILFVFFLSILIYYYFKSIANFKLPEVGEFFDSIEFTELDKEESEKLIEEYNREGERAGFGPKKTGRGGAHFGGRRGNYIDRRGGYSKFSIIIKPFLSRVLFYFWTLKKFISLLFFFLRSSWWWRRRRISWWLGQRSRSSW